MCGICNGLSTRRHSDHSQSDDSDHAIGTLDFALDLLEFSIQFTESAFMRRLYFRKFAESYRDASPYDRTRFLFTRQTDLQQIIETMEYTEGDAIVQDSVDLLNRLHIVKTDYERKTNIDHIEHFIELFLYAYVRMPKESQIYFTSYHNREMLAIMVSIGTKIDYDLAMGRLYARK